MRTENGGFVWFPVCFKLSWLCACTKELKGSDAGNRESGRKRDHPQQKSFQEKSFLIVPRQILFGGSWIG